jgi:NADH-quinone oxidoreductase subunit N
MVIGNLFALRQQNIKRFLAFSSIAQVGFILVGISSNDKGRHQFRCLFYIDLYILQPGSIWSSFSDRRKNRKGKYR